MNLQYISDSNGKTTGVFIPINDWNELKIKFGDLADNEIDIPEWHKNIVRERLLTYKSEPQKALDFDSSLDDIEKKL